MKKKKNIIIVCLFIAVLFCTVNVYADTVTCQGILGSGLYNTIKDNVLKPLKVIAPILLIVFTSIDFAKVVFSDGKDDHPKAGKNFMKRAIATLIVFFAKDIINFILDLGGLCEVTLGS